VVSDGSGDNRLCLMCGKLLAAAGSWRPRVWRGLAVCSCVVGSCSELNIRAPCGLTGYSGGLVCGGLLQWVECDGILRRVQVRWAPAVRSVAVRLASRRWARWRPRPSGHLMCGRLCEDVAPRAEASCVASFTAGSVKTSAQQRPHAR
jgi:hypothetical protein